jgi:hypothetical protein
MEQDLSDQFEQLVQVLGGRRRNQTPDLRAAPTLAQLQVRQVPSPYVRQTRFGGPQFEQPLVRVVGSTAM